MFFNAGEGNLIMLFVTMTVLTVVFVFFLIASLVRLKSRQLKREEQLLRALIEERERTMHTISTEIHDNVNQMLSLARMSVSMIRKTVVPEQRKYLDECGSILDIAIGDLRNISHLLNAKYLKQKGLIESLQEMIKWVGMSKNIRCDMDIEGYDYRMQADIELMLLRIAQEAIQNIIRHSRAENMMIKIDYQSFGFKMSILDDGIGFSIDSNAPWSGMGLQSIYERSRLIQADIQIQAAPGKGTQITLELDNPHKLKLPA